MGSALSSAPTQLIGIEQLLADFENGEHKFDLSLRSTRFLKTARTKYRSTMKVAKVFVKQEQGMDLTPYIAEIERIGVALEKNHNVQTFRKAYENDKAGVLIRQYFFSNLYDRLATRPQLNVDEKGWIIFQLFKALHGCHTCQVCHGDIKIDNVLLTSWNWVFLADFASFKPTHLPVDNPAAFSYFFDTSGRRTCCIAPERFYNPDTLDGIDSHICRFDGKLLPAMDIFSLGCVIYELITEGKPLFSLAGLLAYRQGELDIEPFLTKIVDPDMRNLVRHMLNCDPSKRLSATEYLQRYRGTVFPDVFYSFLHPYMLNFVAGAPMSPDQKIIKLKRDFEQLCDAFDQDTTSTESGNRFVIVGSLVCACVRSLSTTPAKLVALDLLLALSTRVLDEYKIDRFLPFMIALLGDHIPLVRVTALRVLTKCVGQVEDIRASDLNLFPEYIIPYLTSLKTDSEVLVRAAYAEHIAQLAETAQRFLETAQLSIMKASEAPDALSQQNSNRLSFDLELNMLRDLIQDEVVTIMTDQESIVKQTILASNISKLCVFLGPQRASDVLLSHMLTFFNDKRDWRLRAVFFDSIVGVATYCGSKSLERFILPLMEKCLADHEEFVVKQTIDAMTASVELGLFHRSLMLSLTKDIVPLLQHPGVWIRCAVVAFVSAVSKTISMIDLHTSLIPLLKDYLSYPCVAYDDEAVLLNALAPPLPRDLYHAALSCRDIADLEIMYDALLLRKLHRGDSGPSDKSLRRPNETQKHSHIIGFLTKRGLTPQSEAMLLNLELYIFKVWRELRAVESDQQPRNMLPIVRLKEIGIELHDASAKSGPAVTSTAGSRRNRGGATVEGSEKPSKSAKKAKKVEETPMVRNLVTGLATPIAYIQPDLERFVQDITKGHRRTPSDADKITVVVKRKQARAAAEARDRDVSAMRSWRPEGKMVGHLHEHKKAVNQLLVSPDAKFFASCSDDGSVRIWDCNKLEGKAVTNQSRQQYSKQGRKIRKIEICDFNQSIASASDDGTIHLTRVDLPSKSFAPLLKRTMDDQLDGAAIDLKNCGPSSSMLVYGTARGRIHGWDLRMNVNAWCLKNAATEGLISNLLIDPEQNWMSYGTTRGIYVLYDLRFLLPVKSWKDPRQSAVGSLAHYPQCSRSDSLRRNHNWDPTSWMLSAAGSNDAAIWDMKTSQITALFHGTQTAQELDLSTLQAPMEAANARSAADVSRIAPAQNPVQLYEEELKRGGKTEKSNLGRLKWPQLSQKEKMPFVNRAARDSERYEDELTAALSSRWTGPPPKTTMPGIRAMCTTPGTSAAFLGGSDGHIRVWDLERPHESYILGESRPPPGVGARVDLQTTYEVYSQGYTQILKENLGYEARARTTSSANAARGPVAPNNAHGNSITSLAVLTAPDKFLISGGRDGVIKIWR